MIIIFFLIKLFYIFKLKLIYEITPECLKYVFNNTLLCLLKRIIKYINAEPFKKFLQGVFILRIILN